MHERLIQPIATFSACDINRDIIMRELLIHTSPAMYKFQSMGCEPHAVTHTNSISRQLKEFLIEKPNNTMYDLEIEPTN